MVHILASKFQAGETLSVNLDRRKLFNSFLSEQNHKLDRFKFIYGHTGFGLHRYLSNKSSYITILRHPIERVISQYCFSQIEPSLGLRGMSLGQYIADLQKKGCDNHQTRFLADFWFWDDPPSICNQETLDRAKSNLNKYFLLAGIQERFQQSLILLARLLGTDQTPLYLSRNTSFAKGFKKPLRDELCAKDMDALSESNQYDLELYNYAKEQFVMAVEPYKDIIDDAIGQKSLYQQAVNGMLQKGYNSIEYCSQKLKTNFPKLHGQAIKWGARRGWLINQNVDGKAWYEADRK